MVQAMVVTEDCQHANILLLGLLLDEQFSRDAAENVLLYAQFIPIFEQSIHRNSDT
jgi:hypothetical protein